VEGKKRSRGKEAEGRRKETRDEREVEDRE
jgi:hypothetical protein